MSATQNVTVNAELELFVIKQSYGYSCLGFDVTLTRTKKLVAWLANQGVGRLDDYTLEPRGTIASYRLYQRVESDALTIRQQNGGIVPTDLTDELTPYENRRVEVVDCYGEKRRFWVSKSTGPIPVHIEVKRRDSTGGCAVTGTPFQSVRVVA